MNYNEQRVEWAYRTCLVFAQQTGQDWSADGADEIISDLLTDLHHLADQYGSEWAELLDRAARHYYAEGRDPL